MFIILGFYFVPMAILLTETMDWYMGLKERKKWAYMLWSVLYVPNILVMMGLYDLWSGMWDW